jgi:uncharacterized membrane protein
MAAWSRAASTGTSEEHGSRCPYKLRSLDEVALFLHLVGVVTLFSGMVVAAVGLAAARRRERPEVALLLGLTRIGVVLVAGGLVLTVACGFWLLALTEFDLGDGWVGAALGLVVLGAILGALGGQRPKRARLLAERRADAAELRRLLADPFSLWLNVAAGAAYLAVLALMVWKP